MKVFTLDEKAQALDRLMRLKDISPFILIIDSVVNPAGGLLAEFEHRLLQCDCEIIHIRLEFRPNTIQIESKDAFASIKDQISGGNPRLRKMVIIDNLNRLEDAASILPQVMRPGVSILGVYHKNSVAPESYEPSAEALIRYMATSVLEITPSEAAARQFLEDPLEKVLYTEANRSQIAVTLTHRRKSGRAIAAQYLVNSATHEINFVPPQQAKLQEDSIEQLRGLTTFNLDTSERQREARDGVPLPFLDAQHVGDGGAQGGAIIYEFEKDDDYDEEDPYEDPF